MKRLNWLVLLPFGLAVLLAGCATAPPPTADASHQIYDPKADGKQQLAAALSQAQKTGKRVLLDLGANWCSDSQATYRLLTTDPAIRQELEQHFVLALVDVNQQDGAARNQELVATLGNPLSRGIPVLLVLAPDGKVLNTEPTERLRDDAHTDPARVLAYLQKWSR